MGGGQPGDLLRGMVCIGAAPPFPAVQLVGWEVGVRPVVLDRWWRGFILYVLAGSVLQMLVQRWRRKRAEAAAFQAHWRELRKESHGQAAGQGV